MSDIMSGNEKKLFTALLLMFSFTGENKSIDKSMIPYYGTHNGRKRINNKPVQVGYKIWVVVEAYGYVVHFEPYQGVKKRKEVASCTERD